MGQVINGPFANQKIHVPKKEWKQGIKGMTMPNNEINKDETQIHKNSLHNPSVSVLRGKLLLINGNIPLKARLYSCIIQSWILPLKEY